MSKEKRGVTTPAAIPAYLQEILKRNLSSSSCERNPPGGYSTVIPKLCSSKELTNVAMIVEHRFAFYYWVTWKKEYCLKHNVDTFSPPNLFTLDTHNDFGGDCDFSNVNDLLLLNQDNLNEIALFTWGGLRSLNDGHIYPAVMLNLVGNVFLLTRARKTKYDCENSSHTIKDLYGNNHRIVYVRSLKEFKEIYIDLQEYLIRPSYEYDQETRFYFDVDLDYFFTGDNLKCLRQKDEKWIRDFFQKDADAVQIILNEAEGITFAIEPDYTRGPAKSIQQYTAVFRTFFDADPLSWNAVHWNRFWQRWH